MKSKKNITRWLTPLIACAILTSAAIWRDLAYNDGRLVCPMDSYAFRPTDIPVIAALVLDFLYALYLVVLLAQAAAGQGSRFSTRLIAPMMTGGGADRGYLSFRLNVTKLLQKRRVSARYP